MKRGAVVLLMVVAAGSGCAPKLASLKKPERVEAFTVDKDHLRQEHRGLLNVLWVQGLGRGAAREVAGRCSLALVPIPPPPFTVGLAESDRDLEGVLALQRASRAPTPDGFVTVEHTLDILRAMHAIAPSAVARDPRGGIAGYAIVMTQDARVLLPILEPMFAMIERLPPGALSAIPDPRWYVMGQIAVAPAYRGRGVFDALYAEHRSQYRSRFDLVITEVATRNARSMRAHQRVGFRTVTTYRDATDEWALIGWDWSSPLPPRPGRDAR